MSRRLRRRLKAKLRRRQQGWATAAEAAGLVQAIAEEDSAAHAVKDAIAALLGTPANTLAAVRLKLAVLLATGAPDAGDCNVSPWDELHLLLADLHRLEVTTGRRGTLESHGRVPAEVSPQRRNAMGIRRKADTKGALGELHTRNTSVRYQSGSPDLPRIPFQN